MDKAGENVAIESDRKSVAEGSYSSGSTRRHDENRPRRKWRPDARKSNVVRSIRPVGEWSGKPLEIGEQFPEGQDVAVVIESPNGGIIFLRDCPTDPPDSLEGHSAAFRSPIANSKARGVGTQPIAPWAIPANK